MKVLGCSVLLMLWACCRAQAPCGKPENRDKEEAIGPLKNEYQHLDTVQYSCRPGYIKMGRIVYTCSNGVWTKTGNARCREKPCGHPGDLEFGTFELSKAEEFVFGARVEYKCDEGYQMISRVNYRDCTATGWSNSVPFCESRKCVQFPAPKNGKVIATGTHNIDDDIPAGHVLRFECDSPLARPVPNEVYCTSSGQWSSDSVECREINCPEPAIPHGIITNRKPVFRKDERLEFYCEMGYKYEGRPPECTEEGWNPKPFCKEIECYYQNVANGEMLPRRDKYRQDDTVDLKCNSGFVALYSNDRKPTCTIDGWVPPLKCESKACDNPDIEKGQLSSWYYRNFPNQYFPMTKGREIDYACYRGYATESGYGSGRITCSDEGWTPAPRCRRTCERPYFKNMDVHFNKDYYTEGQTVYFRCYPGFFTHEGQEAGTVECLSNGQFSQATCIRMCKLTLTVAIKSYKPKKPFFDVEDTVQYECNDGYHSYQNNIVDTSECTTEGWQFMPQCKEITCSLNVGSRGHTRSFKNGDVAKLKCQERLKLDGADKVQCYYFGWYPKLPSCRDTYGDGYPEYLVVDDSEPAVGTGVNCLEPPKLPNTNNRNIESAYEHGETVVYSCTRNGILYGSETITCENGRWTSPPQCTERRSCNNPPTITNGKYEMPTTKKYFYSDDTVTYLCNPGYSITGSNGSTCMGGRWTAAPTCDESRCDVPSINYGSVVEKRAHYVSRATVSFKCESGYKLISERQTQCLQGKWQFLPKCISTSCGAAPRITNGDIIGTPQQSYQSGERVTYRCKQGFVFPKLSYVTCEESQWTELPKCIKEGSNCGPVPPLLNGDIEGISKPSYPSGTVVEYKCQSYHKILGDNKVTCKNGAWSALPECLEPCTASREEMDKNNIIFRWSDQQKLYTEHEQPIEFICKSNDYITHQDSPALRTKCIRGKLLYPTCIAKGSCTPSSQEMDPKNIIPLNENAEIKNGNMAEFACKPGFYKKPNQVMRVKCVKGKLDYPECDNTPPVCSRPPLVPHGKLVGDVKNEYNQDSSIEYICDEDYDLEGTRSLICFGGTWSGDVPQCIQPCHLSKDEMDKNFLELYQPEDISKAVKHKTSVPFKCKEGYVTGPNSELFLQCKNGTITYPSCVIDSPCQVTKDKLEEHYVELSSIHRDKTAFKEGDTITFKCKTGFRVPTPPGIQPAKCTKDGFTYPTCINPAPCRVKQEGTDSHNLELVGDEVTFQPGAIIQFKCKPGYFKMDSLNGTCKNSNIIYPTCGPKA
ncbi:complement factor H-like isoform X2 [Lissotriton helveticus]